MAYPRYRPGVPLGPNNPFDATTENRLRDSVEELEARYFLPPLDGESTPATTVKVGRVSTATAAVITVGGDVMVPGELEAWQAIRRPGVARFDAAAAYVVGNFATLSADPYDAGTSYAIDDWSSHSGSVYKANTATTGTRNAGHWTLVDTIGIKRANTTVAASAYDGAEWDDVPDDADCLIDRNQETVTLPHQETEAPVEGVLVKWIGGEIVWMSCSAPDEWE